MKIIFLDIDGVLNNMNYTIYIFEMLGRDKAYEIMHNDLDIFDPVSLDLLCKLIEHFKDDIKIVLSSTWRLNQKGIDPPTGAPAPPAPRGYIRRSPPPYSVPFPDRFCKPAPPDPDRAAVRRRRT